MKPTLLLILPFLLLLSACKTTVGKLKEKHELSSFSLLSKEEAKKAVVTDVKEGYFEKVTLLEMSIQLAMESPSGNRSEVLENYKKMLQDDIEDFTSEEQQFLRQEFKKALDLCAKIDKNLKLPEIQLIKTKGTYYGAGVYYTRDNSIIIPAAQLNQDNKHLLRTLIHEIFHIYSRYNPAKRDALYAAIGYNKIKKLELSDFLIKRVIYNPDGVDLAYAIEVQDSSGRSFKAIPSMYSKFSSYRMPLLKSYVFQLFEVKEQKDGSWKVMNADVGYSEEMLSGYWEKIGRNTRYTIHPDEVTADNFTILAFSKEQNDELNKLSEEGKKLLLELEKIIKQ